MFDFDRVAVPTGAGTFLDASFGYDYRNIFSGTEIVITYAD